LFAFKCCLLSPGNAKLGKSGKFGSGTFLLRDEGGRFGKFIFQSMEGSAGKFQSRERTAALATTKAKN